MKKTLITAVAVLALVAPLATSASAQQPNMQQHQGQYQNQDQRDGDQARDREHRADNGQRRDRRGHRRNWRDTRSDSRWDEAQHNGYYSDARWHYGPPPQNYHRQVTYGYHRWGVGQRLGYYNSRYQEVDYRRHSLRTPRRGYHWVQDNDGDFLLAAIVTGVIISVVLSRN